MAELAHPEQYPVSISGVRQKLCRQLWNKKVPEENTGKIALLRLASSLKCRNIAIELSANATTLQKSYSVGTLQNWWVSPSVSCALQRAQQLTLHMLWHAPADSNVSSSGSEWADASK